MKICINFASIAALPRISFYGRKRFSVVVQLALCVKQRFCVGADWRGTSDSELFSLLHRFAAFRSHKIEVDKLFVDLVSRKFLHGHAEICREWTCPRV